jgi:hypothetical protein
MQGSLRSNGANCDLKSGQLASYELIKPVGHGRRLMRDLFDGVRDLVELTAALTRRLCPKVCVGAWHVILRGVGTPAWLRNGRRYGNG